MSFSLYDEALVKRLRKLTGDGRIHLVTPDLSVQFLAQFDKDKVEYPAIVISRGPISLTDTRNQVALLKGQTSRLNSEDNTATKVKLIPIRMGWSIDIYTVDRFSCDEIMRELIFYFMTYPRFSVEVPYGAEVDQNFDILVDPNIVDNSDLVNFPESGEFFRETLTIYTENAHLFSTGRIYLTEIDPDVESK